MKRMKIAIVSDSYLPTVGGLEVHMHDLAHELTLNGHEAHVICVTPSGPDREIFPVHRIPASRLLRTGRVCNAQSFPVLEELLRKGRYDVVHSHCLFSPLGHAGAYLAKKLNIPSVFTLHSVLRGVGGVALRLIDRFYPWSTWPTILTAVSNFVAEELRAVTGRDVHVLLNATRTEDWQLPRREEHRVVSVLRFSKRKRPLDLIEMVPQVLARLPRAQWPIFTLVGDGPQRQLAERTAARLGVREHLEFTGVLARPQVRELLARSAVFALPSYLEALPIAIIEARSAGVPVVARTPNGVAEIIEHGEQGYLARDTEEFVGYLSRLLGSPDLRAAMSEKAQQDLERFTWPRSIERHLHIYKQAMEHGCESTYAPPRYTRAA